MFTPIPQIQEKSVKFATGLFACVVACVATTGLPLQAGKIEKSDSKVKVTYQAGQPDSSGKQVIVFQIDVQKGWYIYANPVKNEFFEPNATQIKLKAKSPSTKLKVFYPKPIVKEDNIVGNYNIYKGKVKIQTVVVRGQGETGPLQFVVQVNACSLKGQCLKTGTVSVSIK